MKDLIQLVICMVLSILLFIFIWYIKITHEIDKIDNDNNSAKYSYDIIIVNEVSIDTNNASLFIYRCSISNNNTNEINYFKSETKYYVGDTIKFLKKIK